jgi:hypothetical protein
MLLGAVIVPIIPVSMNFGSELTFPIAPILTNGILLSVGQGMGAILGIVETYLAAYSPELVLLSYVICAAVASFCSIFMVEDLKKTNFAKNVKLHQA